MFRRIGRTLLGAALVCLACGCIEGTRTITLNPDGRGKVTYDFVMASTIPIGTTDLTLDKQKQQSLEQFVRQKGVVAWKDVSVEWAPDGRLHYVATAYFEKADDLKDLGDMHITKGEEENSLKVTFTTTTDENAKKKPPPDLAKMSEKELDEYIFKSRIGYQAGRPMLLMLLTDMKVKTVVRVPGELGELKGLKKEDAKVATYTIDGNSYLAQAKTFFAQDDAALKKRIKEAKSLEVLVLNGVEKSVLEPELTYAKGAAAQFDFDAEVKKAREEYPALRKKLNLDAAIKLPGEAGKAAPPPPPSPPPPGPPRLVSADESVKAVEKLGGSIFRDERAAGKPVMEVHLSTRNVTDADLKDLAGLTDMKKLYLNATKVTDAGLKDLAPLKALQKLSLASTKVTDAGLKELAPLQELRQLDLEATLVQGPGLKDLAGLKRLEVLNLSRAKLSDAGLKEVAGLKGLTKLELSLNALTDAGLKDLAGLKGLKELNMGFTKVTNAGLKELGALPELETLSLARTKVTDAGLGELAALKSLRKLSLYGTSVTDSGLKDLAGITRLESLDLDETQVTGAGLKDLAVLKDLKALNLRGTKVTDAGLNDLSGLKALKELNLYNTAVTDAAVNDLAALKGLERLNVRRTKFTDAGRKELSKALPDCMMDF
jgi:Leucine-rich repeat (LRR) protein